MSFGDEEVLRLFFRYSGAINESLSPDKIKVRVSSNTATKDDAQRILLLSKDRLHYQVLKINNQEISAQTDRDEDISMG